MIEKKRVFVATGVVCRIEGLVNVFCLFVMGSYLELLYKYLKSYNALCCTPVSARPINKEETNRNEAKCG